MYLYGSFINQKGDTITVHIVTKADRTHAIEIGADAADIYFTDDPVDIVSEVNDTFDHVLRHSASVRLLARHFISDFFQASARDAVVNIFRRGECLFAGFIEPQTYTQPYNEKYDEIELNCIDALSALQYSKFKNTGTPGMPYGLIKKDAGQSSFHRIITEILNDISKGLDLTGGSGAAANIMFDGSKAVDSADFNRYTVFEQLSISELLFLGDEEDDVWQQDEVLEEILRYLNLHIIQTGFTFYIFSWETIRKQAPIVWHDIVNGNRITTPFNTVIISNDNAADCGTTINIGEVYNQILLTCKTEKIENVIESPLDDNSLVPVFDNKQKYCTEYSADGEGKSAHDAFYNMCHGKPTTYGAGRVTDWFIRVMDNPAWIFPKNGDTSVDLVHYFCDQKTNQQNLPNYLGGNLGAAIMAIGSVDTNTSKDDNSPISRVNMTNYLVVSVNGNNKDGEQEYYPNAKDISSNIPYAVYTGNSAGGNFSPVDDEVTNYIVFSGRIILNPLMLMTGLYTQLHDLEDWSRGTPRSYYWRRTAPSRDNKDGRYYTRQYWKAENPNDEVTWDRGKDYGLVPFTGKGPEQYEFKYSAIGDSTDQISKVSVLACMLVIGNQCVVETGTQGRTSDFEWRTYKTREQCSSDDEYYRQCFYIGFDPKMGDKLVGTEFNIQRNFSYTKGIDAEGTAIPIRKEDKVSGRVQFMILGPVNAIFEDYTRRHPTFFRHTKWSSTSVPLLAHVSNIMIKQFEVKVYSDNGMVDTTGDNDLIYMSDTREEFMNKKDDIEFKINSALTKAECKELNVANTINLSTPLNTATKDGLVSVYDYNRQVSAKPEQLYVDSYYKEYHSPRVIMGQNLEDRSDTLSLFCHFKHPAMDKVFYVQGLTRNLMEGTAKLKIKEVNDD